MIDVGLVPASALDVTRRFVGERLHDVEVLRCPRMLATVRYQYQAADDPIARWAQRFPVHAPWPGASPCFAQIRVRGRDVERGRPQHGVTGGEHRTAEPFAGQQLRGRSTSRDSVGTERDAGSLEHSLGVVAKQGRGVRRLRKPLSARLEHRDDHRLDVACRAELASHGGEHLSTHRVRVDQPARALRVCEQQQLESSQKRHGEDE